MQVRITTPDNNQGAISLNGVEYVGPIPPTAGDLRVAYNVWKAAGNVPLPYEAPPVVAPRSTRMWRARAVMKLTPFRGITLFDAVKAAVASLPEQHRVPAEEALEYGDTFSRDGQFVPMLAGVLGLTETQMQELMLKAEALPA